MTTRRGGGTPGIAVSGSENGGSRCAFHPKLPLRRAEKHGAFRLDRGKGICEGAGQQEVRFMDGTTQLIETDRRFLVHPLHHPDDHRQPLVVVEGKGAMLRDADGREYIDGLSGLWNVNVGHGRAELADAASAQMRRIAFASAYIGATNEPAVRLAETIVGHAYPSSAAVYFTTAGAESNESAFKFARYYWKIKDKPQKTKVISRIHAYHGVTLAAMSATGMASYQKMFGPLVPGFIQVAPPYAYRRAGDGGGRRHRSTAKLFPSTARDLRPPRRPADCRRGDHRVWPHRKVVRARPLGRRAGHRLLRQRGDERVSAAGRRDCIEARA